MITYLQENYVELIGASTSLLYLFFEINQKKIMWVIGFLSSAFYVYIYFNSHFYAYMGLNIYYLLASIYGWIIWALKGNTRKEKIEKSPQIRNIHLLLALRLTLISIALFLFIIFFLWDYTSLFQFISNPSEQFKTFILWHYSQPKNIVFGLYIEALTTALSIVATWMLAHKILEQWWVWLFVNTLSMGLFIWRGLYPTAILFFCYAAASVIGYHKWKKEQAKEKLAVA